MPAGRQATFLQAVRSLKPAPRQRSPTQHPGGRGQLPSGQYPSRRQLRAAESVKAIYIRARRMRYEETRKLLQEMNMDLSDIVWMNYIGQQVLEILVPETAFDRVRLELHRRDFVIYGKFNPMCPPDRVPGRPSPFTPAEKEAMLQRFKDRVAAIVSTRKVLRLGPNQAGLPARCDPQTPDTENPDPVIRYYSSLLSNVSAPPANAAVDRTGSLVHE